MIVKVIVLVSCCSLVDLHMEIFCGCGKIHIAPTDKQTRRIQPPQKTWHLLKIAVKPFRAQSTASKSHSIFAVQAGARHARWSLEVLYHVHANHNLFYRLEVIV